MFNNEEDLWKTKGTVKNSCGSLALHIIGGLNYLIGTTPTHIGYTRDRDKEFVQKNIERSLLVAQLDMLIPLITETLNALTQEDLEAEFPIFFDQPKTTTGYVLVQLLIYLNYHLDRSIISGRFWNKHLCSCTLSLSNVIKKQVHYCQFGNKKWNG